MAINLTLSVHGLVDFVLRTGDIDTRVFNIETMTRGTQLHTYYQAKQNDEYIAEQYLEHAFDVLDGVIILQGRVDGIIKNGTNVIIEELKTTNSDLELFFANNEAWHLGQAECYALMYVIQKNLPTIKVQLTYISQVDETKMIKVYDYTREALRDKVYHYFASYLEIYTQIEAHNSERDESLRLLEFPFANIRESQQIIIDDVSEALTEKSKRYYNAPTGSGKTMAMLFPSLKHLSQTKGLKIFYLTAKGSGKLQAQQALSILSKSAKIKSITLSAKEKMCLNDKVECNPSACPFAVNYYGKLRGALLDIYTNYDEFSQEVILDVARKHELCPFEFQLDLSLYCDVIIADYNYLFDPFVYLRRFFDSKTGEYIALIDEAHNLPRRVCDNYSRTLDFTPFYSFRKVMKGPLHKEVRLLINKIVKYLVEYTKSIGEDLETINEFPVILQSMLEKLLSIGSSYMQDVGDEVAEGFQDFFFSINRFLKLYALYNDDFVLYTEIDNERKFFPKFHLKCLASDHFINEALKMVEHAIFFSATLAPAPYFKTMLGVKGEIKEVPNPFTSNQLLMMVDSSVSLYFKDREQTINEVAAKIIAATSVKIGNYLVYTPSFYYLDQLASKLFNAGFYNLVIQQQMMSDSEKEAYLAMFSAKPQETTIGLAVLGGSFSEGVDLVSDRLSGVIILGVGYPPPSFDKELERTYFDKVLADGNSYAYVYPALNKILQTIGRVIRSEDDYGFVLLIDKRYSFQPYRTYLENYDATLQKVSDPRAISEALSAFFFN